MEWRTGKAEEGDERGKAEEKDRREGGNEFPGSRPFTGVSLAGPSPAQGQGSPNSTACPRASF